MTNWIQGPPKFVMRHLGTGFQLASILCMTNHFNFVDFKPDASIEDAAEVEEELRFFASSKPPALVAVEDEYFFSKFSSDEYSVCTAMFNMDCKNVVCVWKNAVVCHADFA